MIRRAALALAVAVVALGCYGAWAYVHAYVLYRGFAPPRDPPGVPAGSVRTISFYSPALGRTDSYLIYRPPGYARMARRGERFGVLYLLHGTGGGAPLFVNAGLVGVTSDVLRAEHRIRPFLIVIPESSDGSLVDDTEWANTPHGRYESAILATVRAVDRRWPTIRSRRGRVIGGASMGGFGAANVALHHPGMFGAIESFSGYFLAEREGVFAAASRAKLERDSPTLYLRSHPGLVRRHPLSAFVYTTFADNFEAEQAGFVRAARAAGASVRARRFHGRHTWKLWRQHMPAALLFASQHLVGPVPGRPRG